MKINLICEEKEYNSQMDCNILSFLSKKIKDNVELKLMPINNYKCDNASINIFLGVINNCFLPYAKYNILIPSQHTFRKHWLYSLQYFDKILCKTEYIKSIFEAHVTDKSKLEYIGWRSSDPNTNRDKSYQDFLLYCYDTNYTNYQKIIESWKPEYPTLNVINGHYFGLTKTQDNILYHNNLKQEEYDSMLNKCGFHLCLNGIDSFSHNINQCCLVKSIPILINGGPMKENMNDDFCFFVDAKKKKQAHMLGSFYDFNQDSFDAIINSISKLSDETFDSIGQQARINSLKYHSQNSELFKRVMTNIIKTVRNTPKKDTKIKNSELPNVSLITLIHNRKKYFKLGIYNYQTIDYPKDKLEWVIYDTSCEEEIVEKLLPNKETREKMNIKYIHDTDVMTIGATRNKAISLASHDIIVNMDDDDYYYPSQVKKRVTNLIHSGKECVGCSILASFHINKFISFIEASEIYTPLHHKIYPATLCFKKSFWEEIQCDNESINEFKSIFEKNSEQFYEVNWEDILISLVHTTNISNRKTPKSEPNGMKFSIGEKVFKFISTLDD